MDRQFIHARLAQQFALLYSWVECMAVLADAGLNKIRAICRDWIRLPVSRFSLRLLYSLLPTVVALVAGLSVTHCLFAQPAPAPDLWFGSQPNGAAGPADLMMLRTRATITTPSTYFETMGWNFGTAGGGYAGIQDSGSLGKNYIFSLWDPPSGGESSIVYWNPTGAVSRFGGEGTGVHYLNYAMPWQLNSWYRLVVRAWNYNLQTYFALWSYDEMSGIWTHHATFSYPTADVFFGGGPVAFVEDWSGTGQNARRGEYSDGWTRSPQGLWAPLAYATFTVNSSSSSNGKYYMSYDGGVNDGVFYMQCGGTTTPSIAPNTSLSVPAARSTPVLTVGRTLSTAASYNITTNQVAVSWTSDATASPQFSYKVEIFDNPSWNGSPVFSQSDIAPHVRAISAKAVLPGMAYFARVTTTDIFGQMAPSVGTALSMLTVSPASMTFSATVGGNVPASQNLIVSVPRSTPFTANTSEQSCASSNWLTISPSGSMTATLDTTNILVSVNPSGIAGGTTCNGTISLTTAGISQTVNVTMVVAAQVIFTSFGASHSFSSNGSCVSGPNNTGCGPGVTRWIAGSFTPNGAFTLSSIALALNYYSGTNGAVIVLASNALGGTPGTAVIEQWTVPSLLSSGITSVISKVNPTLNAGQTYWVVAKGLADDSMDYWFNGALGLGGGMSSVNQGGWTSTTQPAFEILGSPAGLTAPSITAVGVFRASGGMGVWVLDNGNNVYDAADKFRYFGLAGDQAVAGDWTGNGQTRLGVFRNGMWYLDLNNNGQWDGVAGGDGIFAFGLPGDVAVVGDWNGDGRTKLGVFRCPQSGGGGCTWVLDMAGKFAYDPATAKAFSYGLTGDTPVVNNWNGTSNVDQIGVYRPMPNGLGLWIVDSNGSGGWDASDAMYWYGLAQDIPVVGNWNSGARKRIGVFRNGVWILDTKGNNAYDATDAVGSFGLPGDQPVVGNWSVQ